MSIDKSIKPAQVNPKVMSNTIAGKTVGRIGLGMGSLTHPPHPLPTEEAINILKTALNAGTNFWNAGTIYGTPSYNSLHLLNAYFTKYPEDADEACISVKGCFDMRAGKASNDAEGVRACIDECLAILDGKCRIDIFETCRIVKEVPVEKTVAAIAEYVKAGKIGGIGLSECGAESISKAAAVHPLAAVEIELSLVSRDMFSNGVAATCRELNIPIVAYSPMGMGILSGQFRKIEDVPANSYKHLFPRFQPDAFEENLKLVDEVERLAKKKGCTTGQIAIGWVAAQSKRVGVQVVPIPGSSRMEGVEQNCTLVDLDNHDLANFDDILNKNEVKGARAPARFAHLLDG